MSVVWPDRDEIREGAQDIKREWETARILIDSDKAIETSRKLQDELEDEA
jgi:hypothetical protein